MAKHLNPITQPIIKVYGVDETLIASSSFNEIGLEAPGASVVGIKYTFSDEDDDECIIKIQATDTKWINHIDIAIEDVIHVVWGYVGGPLSAKRSLVVRDIKSNYGPNIITKEIVCTDFATYLKLTNSPLTTRLSPIEYIRQYCSGLLNVTIKSAGDIIYKQSAYEKYGQIEDEVKIAFIDPSEPNIIVPEKLPEPEHIQEKVIYSSETRVGTWSIGTSDDVRKFLEKERDLNVANKSPYTILSEVMQLCPNGPWFISGRDNNLIIHNRNLGSNVYRNYIYHGEPGDLIEFVPETKYESFTKNTISQVGIDPVTKSTHFVDSYLKVLENIRSIKDIVTDNKLTDSRKSQELAEWLTVYNNGYQKFRTRRSKHKVIPSGLVFPTDSFDNPYYEDKSVAKKDVLNVANPLLMGADKPNTYIDPISGILFGYQYATPLTDISEQTNIVKNAARKLEMEKEEASIMVIGDPLLKNDMNISVSNVAVEHTGVYYIKKCEHQITNMGYKVTMDSFKVIDDMALDVYGDSKSFKKGESSEGGEVKETMQIDDEKKFKDESRIFRKWNLQLTKSTILVKPVSLSTGAYQAEFGDIKTETSLEEFLRSNPDTDAKSLIELYKNGDLKFTQNNEEER